MHPLQSEILMLELEKHKLITRTVPPKEFNLDMVLKAGNELNESFRKKWLHKQNKND